MNVGLACGLASRPKLFFQKSLFPLKILLFCVCGGSYRTLVAAADGGLVETIVDAVSMHSIKKAFVLSSSAPQRTALESWSLRSHYIKQFGSPDGVPYCAAREAFVRSLAAYSLLTYIFAIRDRHNGNILIDTRGHLIHIDFGFMLGNSPGGIGFESNSPFKLPRDYLDLLGNGKWWTMFRQLFADGLRALRKNHDRLLIILRVMAAGSELPCFANGQKDVIIERLLTRLHLREDVEQVSEELIASSTDNVFTRLYDTFQYYANGIY